MKVKVSSLKHHPKNKEIYTLSSIRNSWKVFQRLDCYNPLIIDSQNQVISGNRRFESIKRLGWEVVEVNLIEVNKEEEELLLIHFNKQRIKSFKELINEYLILDGYYRKGQGRRTDLTSAKLGKGSSRETISKEIIILPILQTSNENDLILDPFMGSGTTGRVCDKLGRSFVGYDLKGY